MRAVQPPAGQRLQGLRGGSPGVGAAVLAGTAEAGSGSCPLRAPCQAAIEGHHAVTASLSRRHGPLRQSLQIPWPRHLPHVTAGKSARFPRLHVEITDVTSQGCCEHRPSKIRDVLGTASGA